MIITFRYELLNRNNTKIGDLSVENGSVRLNSLAEIKRTGRFILNEKYYKDIDFLNDRIKPIVKINGVEHPMGVFLMPSPLRRHEVKGVVREIEGYDLSMILKEDKFTDRYLIRKNTNYVQAITQIINSAHISNVNIQSSSSTLNRDREFEIGESKLKAVNDLLTELNYTSLYTDRNGVLRANPYILPSNRVVEFEYRSNNLSKIIDYSASDELDIFNLPNIWVAVVSNGEQKSMKSTYENNNPSSPTSTVSRNRRIVDYRNVTDISNQTALNGYVQRLASNASSVYKKISFSTLINPLHEYSNALYVEYPKLGISGKFIETSWEIDLNIQGSMKHEARGVVYI